MRYAYAIPVMERDRRLKGFMRGQTDTPIAPEGFELNNPWRVRTGIAGQWRKVLTTAVRTMIHVSNMRSSPIAILGHHTLSRHAQPAASVSCCKNTRKAHNKIHPMQSMTILYVYRYSLLDLRWQPGNALALRIS